MLIGMAYDNVELACYILPIESPDNAMPIERNTLNMYILSCFTVICSDPLPLPQTQNNPIILSGANAKPLELDKRNIVALELRRVNSTTRIKHIYSVGSACDKLIQSRQHICHRIKGLHFRQGCPHLDPC